MGRAASAAGKEMNKTQNKREVWIEEINHAIK